MPQKPVLSVVIPVYNEAENLPALLRDWQPVFRSTGAPYRVIVIDDGSRDDSLRLLRDIAADDPTLEIHTQPNAGHGAAILNGYHRSADVDWVFQIDSDHQLDTAAFTRLWANRQDYDLLIAQRQEKNATAGRQRISNISRVMVRMLFGNTVSDVNSPYRLMRGERLREALERIPPRSFAPNILLTAWFVRKKSRIFTTTIQNRKER
ncbi:MAG TPA: glycosyltransferase family 2 protein, partial [Puia sp.]|nr:glycosyltransferase family 2 protein [Puia sp.]